MMRRKNGQSSDKWDWLFLNIDVHKNEGEKTHEQARK